VAGRGLDVVLVAAYVALALSKDTQAAQSDSLNPLVTPPSHGGQVVSVYAESETGLMGLVTADRGGTGEATRFASVGASLRRLGVAYDRGLVVRVSNAMELAGSERGVEGQAVADVSGGYRFHVTDDSGPFVRGGIRGILGGDALLYQSMIELPQAHLGYQYLKSKTTFIEAAARVGFSIFGRSDASGEGGRRALDQVADVGAIATLRTGPVHLSADWSHFLTRDGGSAIDWLSVSLCGTAHKLALCTDARAMLGDQHIGNVEIASGRVTQVGLTLGFAGSK